MATLLELSEYLNGKYRDLFAWLRLRDPSGLTFKDAQRVNLRIWDDYTTVDLKKKWSLYFQWLLGGFFIFQVGIVLLSGFKYKGYDLEEYDYLVQIVCGGSFLAIVEIIKVMIKYLFSAGARPDGISHMPLSQAEGKQDDPIPILPDASTSATCGRSDHEG